MQKETLEKKNDVQDTHHFQPNTKYFTICVYILGLVTLCTIIILCLVNWSSMVGVFSGFIHSATPFIIAFFIAYILNPLVRNIDGFLRRRIYKDRFVKGRKLMSIGITYLIVITVITIIILYITPEIIHSVEEIQNNYQKLDVASIQNNLTDAINSLHKTFPDLDFDQIQTKVNDFIPELLNSGTKLLSDLVPVLFSFSVSVVRLIINIVLSIVISCYMLSDKAILKRNSQRIAYAIFPKKKMDSFIVTLKECDNIFSKFIIGKSIDSLIIGIICFVLMRIIGLPYSVFFSVIVGVTNMIPYFGPFIGAVPGVLIYLFIDPVQALIFAIMIFALQQFDGLYLGPKILGGSTGLTPLWVIFGITIGGAYAGVLGMFLGVPVIAVVAYLLNKWINSRLQKKKIKL